MVGKVVRNLLASKEADLGKMMQSAKEMSKHANTGSNCSLNRAKREMGYRGMEPMKCLTT